MSTITTQIQTLLDKAENTKERYAEALTKAEQEADAYKQEIKQAENEARDVYKLYVLDDVQLSAYQEATEKVDGMKKLIAVADGKATDIYQLLKEELADIYTEIKPLLSDFGAENNTNKDEQRNALLNAKVEYLNKVYEAQKTINETENISRQLGDLMVDAGLKKYNYYSSDSLKSLIFSNSYNGTAGIEITTNEIEQAFFKGVIDYKVMKEIK